MPNTTAYAGYALLMFATGIAIPIMAALNGALGARIASPWAAAFILFTVGALATGAVLLANGLPKAPFSAPPHLYAGGLLVSFYILGITWAGPRIGVGNAIFYVLLGQIVTASAIDHFALLGAARAPITFQRGLGVALMLAGVFLARKTA